MKRTLKILAWDALFATLLIAGLFYGIEGAMHVVAGIVTIAFLLSFVLFSDKSTEALRKLGKSTAQHWLDMLFDALVAGARPLRADPWHRSALPGLGGAA